MLWRAHRKWPHGCFDIQRCLRTLLTAFTLFHEARPFTLTETPGLRSRIKAVPCALTSRSRRRPSVTSPMQYTCLHNHGLTVSASTALLRQSPPSGRERRLSPSGRDVECRIDYRAGGYKEPWCFKVIYLQPSRPSPTMRSVLAVLSLAALATGAATKHHSDRVAATWFAGWHADDFPLSKLSWNKYTHVTYSFAYVNVLLKSSM